MSLFRNRYRIESSRLINWDYRSNSAYFVTICTACRKSFFGNISEGIMKLNTIGIMANKFWLEIPQHFPFIKLDEFVIMPNHIHGILVIDHDGWNVDCRDVACNVSTPPTRNVSMANNDCNVIGNKMSAISPKYGSLSIVIRSYKSVVTRNARSIRKDFGWQPRFHDRIIRDRRAMQEIVNYIRQNPINWQNPSPPLY